jgi:D-sedoheptulose 7-phosphate isomerase
MQQHIKRYTEKLADVLNLLVAKDIQALANALRDAWVTGNSIYICGNGGSAGNAIHLANDFLYGAGVNNGGGLRVEALSANAAVITCLANDVGYDRIYSEQLKVKGNPGDVLIVLSGSGNSPNVVNALEVGNTLKMKTFAILGFNGGRCKKIAQCPIHFEIDDMQIAEDLQLIVGHICMQWLYSQNISTSKKFTE